jgi:class 3 adenylate cyclase
MHRLVPEFVIEQYTAGRTGGDLPAVALFVDISGFSTVTDALMVHGQHGAEVLAMLMRAVFDPLVQSVYEQNGFITTFAGDAFTAIFPLGGAQVEGHRRALAAAWHIQERMAAVAEQATPYGTFSVAAKVGLAVGDVYWGIVSAEGGEFRHVVNLFVNIPTVRTEAQLAIFMQSIFALQDRYGGLFNGLDFGDKGSNLLLFWGAPVAYKTDVERALNFILDLQTRTSIPINASVTYRVAHAGFIGSPLREDYTCFGRGVNLAARFMTAAPRGEIWLDEEAARKAQPHFDIEFGGERVFKGFAEKQQVYVLYERKEGVEAFFEGELVGREAELGQLHDFLGPLWEGRSAGAMVVLGDPGSGRSPGRRPLAGRGFESVFGPPDADAAGGRARSLPNRAHRHGSTERN